MLTGLIGFGSQQVSVIIQKTNLIFCFGIGCRCRRALPTRRKNRTLRAIFCQIALNIFFLYPYRTYSYSAVHFSNRIEL